MVPDLNPHLLSSEEAFRRVESRFEGLGSDEAAKRLALQRSRGKRRGDGAEWWRLLFNQFRSPLVILLLVAMAISAAVGETMDVMIVLAVVLMSTLLGFFQEYHASNALAALLSVIQAKATALRDGREVDLPVDEIVVGDIVMLNAGDTIPGDGLLIESKDLFVDESALTGESYPAEKKVGAVSPEARQSERTNSAFEGTHVVSGTARLLILKTGADTEYGGISERLRLREPETDFERGLRRFGEMLVRVTLVFVIAIFAINVIADRPALESFMFAPALAVGMTPELLPPIVSITLARGGKRMAKDHVIVRASPRSRTWAAWMSSARTRQAP